MSLKNVGIGSKAPEVVNVVIEIPRGQLKNKYEVDKETGAVFLDRVNNVAFGYPYDYGYVPDTLCDDGDPLDALVLIDEPLYPGVVVPCRAIGMVRMIDDGEGDEKLICVPAKDTTKDYLKEVDQLGDDFKKYIEHFYTHYKDWKNDWQGVEISFNGWTDAAGAREHIEKTRTEK